MSAKTAGLLSMSLLAFACGCNSTASIPKPAVLEQSIPLSTKRYEVLHAFTNFRAGAAPATLIVAGNRFYGTTFAGGFRSKTNCKRGCGVVFSMALDGTDYRVLHRFKGGAEGAGPNDLVVIGGVVFGVTYQGGGGQCAVSGVAGCGTVFRMSPDGSRYAMLHVFAHQNAKGDGAFPDDVTSYRGDLYGVTFGGGGKCAPNGCGTLFRLSLQGEKFAIVHAFSGGRDGASPNAGLAVMGDALFGTTSAGGKDSEGIGNGTIFRLSGESKYRLIYSLHYGMPRAGLLASGGVLYGTTASGGKPACPGGCGSVFSIRPDGSGFSMLYAFDSLTGADTPDSNLVSLGGMLYGASSIGGTHCPSAGCGTVFRISPAGTDYRVIYSFRGGARGAYPGEIVPVDTSVYGVAGGGPSCGNYRNCGIIYRLQTAAL